MTHARGLSWVFVAVWAAWLFTAQGALAAHVSNSEWVPDLGLAFLLALGAHVALEDAPKAALAVALARCAVSIDPPAASIAACAGAIALARGMRGVVEISGWVPRALLALVCGELVHAWLALVHDVRLGAEVARLAPLAPQSIDVAGAFAGAWPTALSTALAALFFGSWLARLPGVGRLVKERSWRVVASSR